jgi:hypothetical protein
MPPKSVSVSTTIARPSAPLIKALESLSVLDSTLPHSRFVATVGQFIDFSEAFNLADFLARVPAITANSVGGAGIGGTDTVSKAQTHFLTARGEMMSFIMASFATSEMAMSSTPSNATASTMRLPRVGDANVNEGDQGVSAYLRFYALQQSEMESRIVQLQTRIRRELTAVSSPLAQLAALDGKLNEVLASYSRKALAVIPSLLRKRFHYLFNECPPVSQVTLQEKHHERSPKKNQTKRDATLKTLPETPPENAYPLPAFLREMQTVLLAELDIRLQPTQGLIEALAIEIETEEEDQTR